MRSLTKNLRLFALGTPWVIRLLRHLARKRSSASSQKFIHDLVFVTPPVGAEGWILEAICREMGQRLSAFNIAYCKSGEELPPSHRYFFSHYMFYIQALSAGSPVFGGRSYIFATHLEPHKHMISTPTLARLLACADRVICMNSALKQDLASHGTPLEKMVVVVGAASSEIYRPHIRQEDGTVGFCSAFYERKSPDLLLDIVRCLPHRHFVLLGKGWQKYSRFKELSSQPNFQYIETNYADYVNHYARMSVFVSASQLEGGPIPLLEAMMSNAVPVASRTGFAPDIIEPGKNGFLFDIGAPAPLVCDLIEQAFELPAAVHESVQHCDWDAFTQKISLEMALTGHA